VEYFIGLSFHPGSIHYKKIDSFRKRFDSKYLHSELLQLTLIPPFQIDFKNKSDLDNFTEEITDMLEGHLYGLDEAAQLEFAGISFFEGQKGVVSLTPKISPDLHYCQESLYQLLKDNGAHFVNSKNTSNTYLPIGRLESSSQLETAIEIAKLEFSSPFILQAESFILFEKKPKSWLPQTQLFNFKTHNNLFFVSGL
jgi:hypothetical protein